MNPQTIYIGVILLAIFVFILLTVIFGPIGIVIFIIIAISGISGFIQEGKNDKNIKK